MAATPADVALPFDGDDSYEDEWRDMFGSWLADGVIAGLDNSLEVYGDSTGRQVKLKTGRVRLDGEHAKITSEKTLTVGTNTSGNPRIDRLVARLDRSAHTIEFDILAGTPGASPVPPALTSDATTLERSLAQIGPLASGYTTIAAGDVHDERCLLSTLGTPSGTIDARDLWIPSPQIGFTWVGRDDGGIYEFNGLGWEQTRRLPHATSFTPSGNQDSPTTGANWPGGLKIDNVTVPAYATRVRAEAVLSRIYPVTDLSNVDVKLKLGDLEIAGRKIRWDPTKVGPNSDQSITLIGEVDVSALAGQTLTLQTIASRPGTSGPLRATDESPCFIEAVFR